MRLPSTMRPGPCFRPLLTRFGGLSTIEKKFGVSAGLCAHRHWSNACFDGGGYLDSVLANVHLSILNNPI